MCGRYQRRSDKPKIAEAFRIGNIEDFYLELAPSYNSAPQSMQPVIVWDSAGGIRMLQMMFWRFLPPRATDPKTFKLDTINVRGETLLESNMWRSAFLQSRCLVPVDNFIEWRRIDLKTKLPWAFAMKDDSPFRRSTDYQNTIFTFCAEDDAHHDSVVIDLEPPTGEMKEAITLKDRHGSNMGKPNSDLQDSCRRKIA